MLDGTIYYEILDNWVSVDLGLSARKLEGFATVTERTTGQSDRVDLDYTVPMLYGHARFNLPFTGLAVGVRGSAVSYEGNELLDAEAYLHLEVETVLLDIGIEGGFRRMQLTLEDLDAWNSDATMQGPFVSLTAHF